MTVIEILRSIDGNCDSHCAIGASISAEEEVQKICARLKKAREEAVKQLCPTGACLMDYATTIVFDLTNAIDKAVRELCGG